MSPRGEVTKHERVCGVHQGAEQRCSRCTSSRFSRLRSQAVCGTMQVPMRAGKPAASQDGIDLVASREYRVMTYNFGGRQPGYCSNPARERVLRKKLETDVLLITQRCDVILWQEVNEQWAANIIALFPGCWSGYYAKDPTLLTCWNSDVMGQPTKTQECRMFPNPEHNACSYRGWRKWTLALARAQWLPAPRSDR